MAAWAAAAGRMNRICFSLRSCYGLRVWLLMRGEPRRISASACRARRRQGDRQRVGGQAEGGDERDADDRADPAVQDAEPVPGPGGPGSPSPITARTVTCTPWAASSTSRSPRGPPQQPCCGLPGPPACPRAEAPGRWPGPGRLTAPMSQAGLSSAARVDTPAPPCAPTRTTSPGEPRRGAEPQDRPPGAGDRPSSGTRVHPPLTADELLGARATPGRPHPGPGDGGARHPT